MSTASGEAEKESARPAWVAAMNLTGFVLAGGKSTRMGTDKALLDWRGRPLLDHMTALLRTVADPVLTVGREALPDTVAGLGPLSGIATGLEVSFTDANLFVAVDLPLLTREFLAYLRLRTADATEPLVACKIGSGFPLCLGVWRPVLPEIQTRLRSGKLSIRGWIEGAKADIISESELAARGFDAAMFRNINTEEDYRSAR